MQAKAINSSFKERFIRCIVLSYILIVKLLGLPSKWFSRKIKRTMDHWTASMLWTYISSFGKRAYMDQPCTYNIVTDQPKTKVDPKYALTPEQIKSFHEDGFLGHLTAVSEEEMAEIRSKIEKELAKDSKAFGIKTVRDRHLDAPYLMELFKSPAITEALAQLLGPDILIWRSQVFNQEPGAPAIAWHQASTYMLEDYKRPILNPKNRDDLFQLTVWIAIDNATTENGCMQFIRGSHDKIRKIKLGTGSSFYNANFELDMEIDPEKIVSMELRPGQFVILSERCVHGSPGNQSDKRRMGINFRAILPSTSVYEGQEQHSAFHLGKTWDLKNWGVATLRGEDKYQLSKRLS